MASKIRTEQRVFRYKCFTIDKSQPLGRGSYGAVYKAKCDQLPCAAKVLHPTILDPRDKEGAGKVLEKFRQECAFLDKIRHPHIVQYLGMTTDPESKLPVLLMELLDESLTKMLERSERLLPYGVQVDICHDIALAIAYLHASDIIHRDLSSNNVLIIAGRRAKVTDFGMSKLARTATVSASLTACPGTMAYMPPEAFKEPPRYTKKMDCFSMGVVMIQVCTQLWPEPGPRTWTVQDDRSPTGSMEMPVLDIERRKNHIELVDPTHPFLPLIEKSLSYSEHQRPSADELCQRLADVKEGRNYEVVQEEKCTDLKKQIQDLQTREESKNERIKKLEEKVATSCYDLKHQGENMARYRQTIQEMKATIRAQEIQVQQSTAEIKLKEEQLKQLKKQLERQEQVKTMSNEAYCLVEVDQDSNTSLGLNRAKTKLRWRREEDAPDEMLRGTAVVNRDIVYFMHQYLGKVYSYNSTTKTWTKLLYCSNKESSLAVLRGLLTTIGGRKFDLRTSREHVLNKLLSLCVTARGKEWTEHFPPMPTKRYGVTSLVAANYLIVAGGIHTFGEKEDGQKRLTCTNVVEVLNIKSLNWSVVASLPHPYARASAAICGDELFLLGGDHSRGERSLSAMTCSLTKLIRSHDRSSSAPVWQRITDTPHYYSTCVALEGEVLAVGGQDKDDKSTTAVHRFDQATRTWVVVSSMLSARHNCFVAVFPLKLLVVGGESHLCDTKTTNTVEVADL